MSPDLWKRSNTHGIQTIVPNTLGVQSYVNVCGVCNCPCIFFIVCSSCWDIAVNFFPILSWISKYFATHRSKQTASPLFSSESLYFGGIHFFWQELVILEKEADEVINVEPLLTTKSFGRFMFLISYGLTEYTWPFNTLTINYGVTSVNVIDF